MLAQRASCAATDLVPAGTVVRRAAVRQAHCGHPWRSWFWHSVTAATGACASGSRFGTAAVLLLDVAARHAISTVAMAGAVYVAVFVRPLQQRRVAQTLSVTIPNARLAMSFHRRWPHVPFSGLR